MGVGFATCGCTGSIGEAPSIGTGGRDHGGSSGETGSATGGASSAESSGESDSGTTEEPADPCEVDSTPGACVALDACTDGGVSIPGHCAASGELECCVHGEVTCDPEVHVLPNGGLKEAPGTGGCPAGMLRLEDYCIDRFEASLQTKEGVKWSPYFNPGDLPLRAVSLEGAVPQGYISGVQAAAACELAGKRLCTDAEWLRACQGPADTIYPYGDVPMPGVCNDARAMHPVIEYFGTTDDWIWSELDNACLDQLDDSLDRTGQNPDCVTAEGAFDMMGNLHEWTADQAGTFRGGFFVDTEKNGPGCLYKTTAHDVAHWDYSTGFRCCADVP